MEGCDARRVRSLTSLPPTSGICGANITNRIAQFKAKIQKDAKKKAEIRQREAQKREVENLNRKHLAGLRVVQKNLVYVVGLSHGIPEQDLLQTLRGEKYFGQYGKIIKIVVSKAKSADPNSSLGVYVTFARKEDAARCIAAVNGSTNLDRVLRAQLGTTKYCSAYLRNETCTNKQCMFLHEPGDNEESYSRQDLSSINSVGTQRPLPSSSSSSRQVAQTQAPLQQVQPVAAASQPMVRDSSKDGSDSGDGSALPSSASWANRGTQQLSRRGSITTSHAASSPAVSTALPAPVEPVEDYHESADDQQDQNIGDSTIDQPPALPKASVSPRPSMNPTLVRLLKSISALKTCPASPSDAGFDESGYSDFPPLFDDQGGIKRQALREQQEETRLHMDQESQHDLRSISDTQEEEEPESGSLQLGGEPEDRHEGREGSGQPQGFHDQRRPNMQMPIQRSTHDGLFGGGLGQNFGQNLGNLSSINGRTLTPLEQQRLMMFKSGQAQSSFIDQFPPGMSGSSQSSLFQQQGHNRQSSRYNFANDNPSASASAKTTLSSKLSGPQVSMMSSQQAQFYGSSIPGPPPGLKSTGTPPISGGGMFGQSHGFGGSLSGASGFGGAKDSNSDMLREMLRNRGGMASSSQVHDAGKREFMFPSFLHQYPSASTPAPASGLLASLYGSQPGAYQDFGQKQKKKGKKHRHANTSSSGGGGLVDLADPNMFQPRMPLQQQQSNAGVGQGLFGGQGQGGYSQNSMYGGFSRW
jgi:CCR4-NOT transcription complex subunit 4